MLVLLLSVTAVALCAGLVVPNVCAGLARARDAQRLEDALALRGAIEAYYDERGCYPEPDANPAFGGWDVSHDGGFLSSLVEAGFLETSLHDPLDRESFHYRYYVYEAGEYGCDPEQAFYVLGIKSFETPEYANGEASRFRCGRRDWGQEFAWVCGGGARPAPPDSPARRE